MASSAGIAGGGVLKLKTAMAAACLVLLLLTAMGGPPAAMADLTDDCREYCSPKCTGCGSDLCGGLIGTFPSLDPLIGQTCFVRVYETCMTTCINLCTVDTLPPIGSTPETPEPVPETPEPVPETPETPETPERLQN